MRSAIGGPPEATKLPAQLVEEALGGDGAFDQVQQ